MGCDIHLYIEYRNKEADEAQEWRYFGGRFNPGRNYMLFGILAEGVRSVSAFGYTPRGLPEGLGYVSRDESRIFISEHENGEYVTMEKALTWAQRGYKLINNHNGKPTWVEHPDWHSHSWLTTQEYHMALEFYNNQNNSPNWLEPEYEAVLSSLKRLEELGYTARVVFWFDN